MCVCVSRFYSSCVLLGLEFLHANSIVYRWVSLPDALSVTFRGRTLCTEFSFCLPGI